MAEIKVLNEKHNPLFNRKEVQVSIDAGATPKTSEAEEFVAKQFSSSAENVKIKMIKGKFGSTNFVVTANIYSSKEDKDKIESKAKKEKKKKEAAK
jgi:ribosomal protein S24E